MPAAHPLLRTSQRYDRSGGRAAHRICVRRPDNRVEVRGRFAKERIAGKVELAACLPPSVLRRDHVRRQRRLQRGTGANSAGRRLDVHPVALGDGARGRGCRGASRPWDAVAACAVAEGCGADRGRTGAISRWSAPGDSAPRVRGGCAGRRRAGRRRGGPAVHARGTSRTRSRRVRKASGNRPAHASRMALRARRRLPRGWRAANRARCPTARATPGSPRRDRRSRRGSQVRAARRARRRSTRRRATLRATRPPAA